MNSQLLIITALLLPIIGIIFISLTQKNINLRETCTLIASVALIYVVYSLLPEVLNGARPELHLFNITSSLAIHFQVEPLGRLYACQ
jgi:multicomponent Na+:H+ antiporter subunit D